MSDKIIRQRKTLLFRRSQSHPLNRKKRNLFSFISEGLDKIFTESCWYCLNSLSCIQSKQLISQHLFQHVNSPFLQLLFPLGGIFHLCLVRWCYSAVCVVESLALFLMNLRKLCAWMYNNYMQYNYCIQYLCAVQLLHTVFICTTIYAVSLIWPIHQWSLAENVELVRKKPYRTLPGSPSMRKQHLSLWLSE